MDDFDLISEPSTAQAVLGARPRLRDPRAVEVDDFDFDPNMWRGKKELCVQCFFLLLLWSWCFFVAVLVL